MKREQIIEILKEHELLNTDGVHVVMIKGIFPEVYGKIADRIIRLQVKDAVKATATHQPTIDTTTTPPGFKQRPEVSEMKIEHKAIEDEAVNRYDGGSLEVSNIMIKAFIRGAKWLQSHHPQPISEERINEKAIFYAEGKMYSMQRKDAYIDGFKAALKELTKPE